MTRWRRFERLAEKIMRDLTPHAEVKWDDHIVGQDSEAERQIDVSVRWTDGDERHLLVIDAKDWARPADVGNVEKFAGLVKDVRANNGILVCNAGFTRQALVYAKNLCLGLFNLHDAESRDWSRDLTIPIVWIELTPQIQISSAVWFDAGDQVRHDEKFPLILSPDDGSPDEPGPSFAKINILSTFARAWNSGSIPQTTNTTHHLYDERPLRALVRDALGTMRWRPVRRFELLYTVQQSAWLGQFRPAQCQGLIDYLDERAFLASYLPISEVPMSRDDSWVAIEDPGQVALSVRGTVVTSAQILVLDETSGETHSVSFELIEGDEVEAR
jgi:Restriction endonuclease